MTSLEQNNEKKMNHLVMRTGLVISAISILTFLWTSVIQPILTIQQQILLLTYRVNALEKVVESLNGQEDKLPSLRPQLVGELELEAQRKDP